MVVTVALLLLGGHGGSGVRVRVEWSMDSDNVGMRSLLGLT
jgi:hypothetical protein